MFGSKISPLKFFGKENSGDPKPKSFKSSPSDLADSKPRSFKSNPFDSVDLNLSLFNSNPFDSVDLKPKSLSNSFDSVDPKPNSFRCNPFDSVDLKHNSIHCNPFDSDDDSDGGKIIKSQKTTSLKPVLTTAVSKTKHFDKNGNEERNSSDSSGHSSMTSSLKTVLTTPVSKSKHFDNHGHEQRSSYSNGYGLMARNKYKNGFSETGGYANQSVQELENYAVCKAEETTETVNDCLRIAEDIKNNASTTLVTLHQQGEQITRTHKVAADIDHDLSRGEKLLGSLGGLFSRTWRPKKSREIVGPVTTRDDSYLKRSSHIEQNERAGLDLAPKGRPYSRTPPPKPTNALEQVQCEKEKQDDALSNISNILDDLKTMAVDMGSEIERQNKAMDHLYEDLDEVNFRVKGANQRARRLLGK